MILSIVASWYSWDHLRLRGNPKLTFFCARCHEPAQCMSARRPSPCLHPSSPGAPFFPSGNAETLNATAKPLPLGEHRAGGLRAAQEAPAWGTRGQGRVSSIWQWGGSSAIQSRTVVGTFAPSCPGVSEVTQLPFGLFYLPHLPSFLVLFATAYASRPLLVWRNQPRRARFLPLT